MERVGTPPCLPVLFFFHPFGLYFIEVHPWPSADSPQGKIWVFAPWCPSWCLLLTEGCGGAEVLAGRLKKTGNFPWPQQSTHAWTQMQETCFGHCVVTVGPAPSVESPPSRQTPAERPHIRAVPRGCGEPELGARSWTCLGSEGRGGRVLRGHRGAGRACGPAGSQLLQPRWGLLRAEKVKKVAS